jgi:hypothetical protein
MKRRRVFAENRYTLFRIMLKCAKLAPDRQGHLATKKNRSPKNKEEWSCARKLNLLSMRSSSRSGC